MALNNSNKIIMARRREAVARLRLKGNTQREIAVRLAEEKIVNPDSGEPYDVATINRDIKAIEAEWRASAIMKTDEHKAHVLAKLWEVERLAFKVQDLDAVIAAIGKEMKLLGLEAPTKVAPVMPDGETPYDAMSLEDIEAEIVTILTESGLLPASGVIDG